MTKSLNRSPEALDALAQFTPARKLEAAAWFRQNAPTDFEKVDEDTGRIVRIPDAHTILDAEEA